VTRLTVRLARRCGLLLLVAATAVAGPARAQDAAPPPVEDPRAPKYLDVERGLFVGFEVGWLGLLKTPNQDPVKFPFATGGGGAAGGVAIGVNVGYDITERLAIALFAEGASEKASPSYGAFDLLVGGLDLRYAFYGQKDRNGYERFFVYVHGRGGYLISHPTGLFGDTDLLVGGGFGAEYYTQLRHFSVGLQVDGLYVLSAKAPGFAITPVVRYTF
jgi:hypothetical protein